MTTAADTLYESAIVGSIFEADDQSLPPNLETVLRLPVEAFQDPVLGQILAAIRAVRDQGDPVNELSVGRLLRADLCAQMVMLANGNALPLSVAEVEAERLLDQMKERGVNVEHRPRKILKLLEQREFNPHIEPPPLRTIYSLAGTTICTPGNITTITSAIKTGKSAVAGAMSASAMPKHPDSDLLGFESSNPRSLALVSFDTEQSPDDFWHGNDRIRRRAGLEVLPDWYHAYTLTGLGSKQAWEFWAEVLKIVADRHGGIHSILIDGVADLVADVNDPAESNDKVATIHGLAIQYDCPIIGVIHFNPGSEKSRGHLGSQLERKAETNLALEKDSDETTVIYSTKNRRAGIPKSLGPRFAYSVEAGMHVSVASRQSCKEQAERESLMMLALDAYNGRTAMRYSELQSTVKKLLTVSDRTAERKLKEMQRLAVIKKSVAGLYTITQSATP